MSPLTQVSAPLIDSEALLGLPAGNKGDLFVRDETNAIVALPVGAAGTALQPDATTPTGLAYKPVAASAGVFVGALMPGAMATPPAGWLACDGAAVSRTTYADLFAALGTAYGAGDGATTFNVPDGRGRSLVGAGAGLQRFTVSAIDVGTNVLTIPTGDLQTGAAVVYTSTGTAVQGLVSGTTYFWVRLNATQGKLATTRANAVAGTTIDLGPGAGSGTHALQVNLTVRALGELGGEEGHSLTVTEIPAHTHPNGGGISFAAGSGAGPSTVSNPTGSTGGSGAHAQMPPFFVGGWFIYAGV